MLVSCAKRNKAISKERQQKKVKSC